MKFPVWVLLGLGLGCSPAPPPEIPVLDTDSTLQAIRQTGKPLILNLWATWCVPCVEELPALQALRSAHLSEKLAILAVSYDAMIPEETPRSAQSVVQKFLDSHGYTFATAIFWDDDFADLDESLSLPGPIPVTLAFDAKGRELGRVEGKAAPADLAKLVSLITASP